MELKINEISINHCLKCGGNNINLYDYTETATVICGNCNNSVSIYDQENDITAEQILDLWNQANNPEQAESEYLVIFKSKGQERNEIIKAKNFLSAISDFYMYYGYQEIMSVIVKGE